MSGERALGFFDQSSHRFTRWLDGMNGIQPLPRPDDDRRQVRRSHGGSIALMFELESSLELRLATMKARTEVIGNRATAELLWPVDAAHDVEHAGAQGGRSARLDQSLLGCSGSERFVRSEEARAN